MSKKQLAKFAVEFDFTADGESDHVRSVVVSHTESDALNAAIAMAQAGYGGDWEDIFNVKIERVG
jgi:hypothetical protein